MMLYVCTKFRENIRFQGYLGDIISVLKFAMGHFIKKGRIMVFVLCTLSDNAYTRIKFHENISKSFRVIEQTGFLY